MKKQKEIIFIQEYGTYPNQILVCCGVSNKKSLLRFLKKEKAGKDFITWVMVNIGDWIDSLASKNKGAFCFNDNLSGSVLMLRKFENSWDYWEVLIHELHHVVQKLSKDRGMNDEPEAQAYLQEYLFHSIRRKLQGTDKY